MAARCVLLVALLFLLVSSLSALPARRRRRVNPTRIRPITLTDLHFECTVQSWTQCLRVVDSLLNGSHSISSRITECIAMHNPFTSTSPAPPSTTYSNAGNLVQPGGGEVRTGEATTATATAEEECPLTMDERATIRHDVYCMQLFLIDVVLRGMVPIFTFLRDFNCVREYSSSGYRSPTEIVDSIKEWHKEMIKSHRDCCESENRTFSRELDNLYNRTYFTLGERASDCPITFGQTLWDSKLSQVAWLVRMLELMEGLGRRRKCLRGCVSEGQVRCTNLIILS